MRYSNLHNHSTFSDGKYSMEETVLSAIEKNMVSLGFSDHSFTPCDTSYCMKEERYQEYLDTIAALKQKYADRIDLFAGIELDYYTEMDTSALDYVIASAHYIIENGICYPIDHSSQQQKQCIEAFGGDVLAMAQRYFDIMVDHVSRSKPTFVGHFDVITKYSLMPEEDPRYREIACRALEKILKVCPYIEMNTGPIARGLRTMTYPCEYLLDTIRENGGEIILSSDSHRTEHLIYFFDEAVALLKQAGFDHICQFTGKGFKKVAI